MAASWPLPHSSRLPDSATEVGTVAGEHVFRASRWSRGNLLFPTQVAITPASVVHYTPRWFGRREQSIHMAHVASVLIDTNLFFSNVMIESSGGTDPVRCHGHRKRDAIEMKRLIEQYPDRALQSASTRAGAECRTSITLRAPDTQADPAEVEARFQALVQSPLRAAILRFLCARPEESFDVEALMQTFGRMRLDVENCVRELVDLRHRPQDRPARARRSTASCSPTATALRDLLDHFLERRATVTHEDRSPAVQRFREMIGRDEKMLVIFEWIRTAAKSDISVLILGPTGSGKEVVARMIHELSRRGTHKFQAVNCAALPDTLFESEIFGYEKGAFTGAHDRKPGRLELANNGTLFLDEIGDLSLIAQAKLLRVLEERRFERLGGNTSIEVNFRLISATNRPLDQFVRDSRFREDLYYRVNAFSIRLPSLRERASDIPVLAQRFLARYCAANGLPLDGKSFSKEGIGPARPVSLARQHPRAREHGVARGAVVAGPGHPRRPTSSSCTPPRRRSNRSASGCRRSPKPSARTSSGCWKPSAGTRSRRRRCSKSAAARSTGKSSNTASKRSRKRRRGKTRADEADVPDYVYVSRRLRVRHSRM